MHLLEREVLQPALEMFHVDSDADGAPRRVDETDGVVDEGHALEGRQVGSLRDGLRVVGDGPRDGVSDDDKELHAPRHVMYPRGHALCDEVARRLLHRDLPFDRRRHLASVTRKNERRR